MATLLTELRFALRGLVQRPGFSLVVIATLALGIGSTSAIFSVVDGVLLRPLPFPASDELVVVWERNFPRNRERNTVASVNFLNWRAENTSFEDLAAFAPTGRTLTGEGPPERLQGVAVTPSFFSILGVEPVLGRRFAAEEEESGKNTVVLLTHKLWQRRFAGEDDVVGRRLKLNGTEHTVVGVLPQGFALPQIDPQLGALEDAEFFAPLAPSKEYAGRGMIVLGRLAEGVGLAGAQAEMTELARRLEAEHPYNQGWGVNLVPLREQVVGHLETALLLFLGAVGLVLLIACLNVANLLLARATVRRQEIAIRTALGASRLRLGLQLLAESLVLATVGGALGLLLASWGLELLVAFAPEGLPRLHEVAIDSRTVAFTAGASLLAAFIFGLAPMFQVSKTVMAGALKEDQRGALGIGGEGMRRVLVVAEVALALVLLVGSGLLMRSFIHLLDVDPGFEPRNLTSFKVSLPASEYSEPHQIADFYHQLLSRLEALPGVEAAGATMTLPFDGLGIGTSFFVGGQADPGSRERPVADVRPITPGYLESLGIPFREGRDFDQRETLEAPLTAIVSEALVEKFWPGESALGRQVIVSLNGMTPYEIVGVVGDIQHMGLDTVPRSMIYIPHAQLPARTMVVVLRTESPLPLPTTALRRVLAELDPTLPLYRVTTLAERVATSIAEERFNMTLLGVFAALALVLAAVGLYGLLSYSMEQRTREIGIRLALGAARSNVFGLVIRQGVVLTAMGVVLGLIGASGLQQFIASLLFQVPATDLWTYITVALLLAGVAVLASYLPARRAAEVDPIVALRHE